MKKEKIHWLDWHRILFGNAPTEFLIEVFFRTIVIYLLLLLVLRLMGKRMGGQVSITELSVMLTLGAIVSVAMQAPDRGVLLGLTVLLAALAFQRFFTYLTLKSKKFERVAQGRESILIKDSVLCTNELIAMKISREQVFAVIRMQQIQHLGEIERMYLEACGLFSILKYAEPKPGLSIWPVADLDAAEVVSVCTDVQVCNECGYPAENQHHQAKCKNCGNSHWINAVLA